MFRAPQFLQVLPAETDATDGDIVTFQTKVALSDPGGGQIQVSWWRCGEMLESLPGRREIIRHDDGWNELIISNVSEDDDGEYECRAENDVGFTSCFGSLYYYPQGGGVTITDVTLESSLQDEGDGRQSALLILIDDGSHTEEGGCDKKSLTVSEQMQGIIEDLTQSSQGDHTGSMTIEKEDDDQFNSDISDLLDEALQDIRGSQDTLVPESSPPGEVEKAMSEGASDPFAVRQESEERCRSNPNNVESSQPREKYPWPPEPDVCDLRLDTSTVSVELPPLDTEEGTKLSARTPGAETPFGVEDIPEELVNVAAEVPLSEQNGATKTRAIVSVGTLPRAVAFQDISSVKEDGDQKETFDSPAVASTFTSVTDFQELALLDEGFDHKMYSSSRSSFRSTSLRLTSDISDGVSQTSFQTTSARMSSRFEEEDIGVRGSKRLELDDSTTVSVKRSKVSAAAYEADESSVSASAKTSKGADTAALEPLEPKGLDVYTAIMDFRPMESDEEAVGMSEGQQVEVIDATKPRRWLVRTIPREGGEVAKEGWVPACYLEKSTAEHTLSSLVAEPVTDHRVLEALENREAVVRELVESEEDFSKDMQYVVDNYYKHLDDPQVPKEIRDRKGSIFGNFKDISDFHNKVLMKGVHYHSKEPTKLGKTFLRLERDFDMHASYCWVEARAQRLLEDSQISQYFENFSRTIGDDKLLSDHLKLPLQRLNDYQLLLREIIKYSSRLNEDTSDLQKALEFIHSINRRTKDLQYIQSIHGCTGDLLKLGRIVKHDVFESLEESTSEFVEAQVFLFKGRLIIAKKAITSSGDEIFNATALFKLQDVEVVDQVPDDDKRIIFRHTKKNKPGFPVTLRAPSVEQKENLIKEIQLHSKVPEDLGDEEPVLEKVASSEVTDGVLPHEAIVDGVKLKHKAEEPDLKEPQLKKHKSYSAEEETGISPEDDRNQVKQPVEKDSLKRQDSSNEKQLDKTKPKQSEVKKTPESPKGEAGEKTSDNTFTVPVLRMMSEDLSESDARLDSVDTCEESATVASGSLRSPGSLSPPPADGAYGQSLPNLHYTLLFLVAVFIACYLSSWSVFT